MKIRYITGILAALLFPLAVIGQSETYSVKIASFSSKKSDEFGSHEVMLRYEFRYKVEAISPLNF